MFNPVHGIYRWRQKMRRMAQALRMPYLSLLCTSSRCHHRCSSRQISTTIAIWQPSKLCSWKTMSVIAIGAQTAKNARWLLLSELTFAAVRFQAEGTVNPSKMAIKARLTVSITGVRCKSWEIKSVTWRLSSPNCCPIWRNTKRKYMILSSACASMKQSLTQRIANAIIFRNNWVKPNNSWACSSE